MITHPGLRQVSLSELQPSQLYINQEKLARVKRKFDLKHPQNMAPIPFKDLDGYQVMTDGHTRALAAFLAGLETVPAYPDPDELDWEAYRICVAWCHAEGIYTVADLAGRVVSAEDYERLWYDRCRQRQTELAEKRG